MATDKTIQRPLVLTLTACFFFAAAYYPIFQILVKKWMASDEYAHAFLVLPIIGYMVWGKRVQMANGEIRFTLLGLVLVVLSTPLYMFALITQVHTVIAAAMLMAVVGAMVYLGGVQTIKMLFTPILLLAMLIPVPEQLYIKLTFPLQFMVSQASEAIIRLFGIPIFREGNVMTIPQKSFEVVEACSGLRSMITLLTLSVIMGYFTLRRSDSRIVLVAASVPTAILVNIIRVTCMILAFYFFQWDLTEGTLHTVTGLAIFVIALLVLFILQKVLEWWETKSS